VWGEISKQIPTGSNSVEGDRRVLQKENPAAGGHSMRYQEADTRLRFLERR